MIALVFSNLIAS